MEEKRTSDDVIKLLNKLYYGKRRAVGEVVGTRNNKKVKLPLSGYDIDAKIVGRVADVTITQKFRNCFAENLEAIYTFPLSASCSVYSVEMKINDRVTKGLIEERSVAREIYDQAIESGNRACLMEQDRDEVFNISVGNIQPEEEIAIEIKYCETLTFFEDGSTEIRMPLVVAPRYIPGESLAREQVGHGVTLDTDRVPDASRISPSRLVDSFDPETDLNICVSIDPGVNHSQNSLGLTDLTCSQHATRTQFNPKNQTDQAVVTVNLTRKTELLDRDFVLRWKIACDRVSSEFISYKEGTDGRRIGMISIMPPVNDHLSKQGREVVFLLDRSGSMMGEKMISAKRSCKFLLSSLGPNDRFCINAFDHQSDWFESLGLKSGKGRMVPATEEGVAEAMNFLTNVTANGGTEIGKALIEAGNEFELLENLDCPVIVLITDGHIGDESDVLKLVQKKAVGVRVFTVGIDTAVNYGFLERLSNLSGGTSSFVNPGDELEETMRKIARTIGEPLILDLKLEGLNCKIDEATVTPLMLPDLFAGRSADLFFQYEVEGRKRPKVVLTGKFQDGSDFVSQVCLSKRNVEAVPRLWARRVINDLEDQFRCSYQDQDEIQRAIVNLSKQYLVLCRFTAFTVVDDEVISTNDLALRQVVQPVHNPHNLVIGGFSMPSQSFGADSASFGSGAAGFSGFSGSWGAPAGLSSPLYGDCQSEGSDLYGASDSSWGQGQGQGQGQSQSQSALPGWLEQFDRSYSVPSSPPPLSKSSDSDSLPNPKAVSGDNRIGEISGISEIGKQETIRHRGKQDDLLADSGLVENNQASLGSPLIELKTFTGLQGINPGQSQSTTLPLKRVLCALDKFLLLWNMSWGEIERGSLPDAAQLDLAYTELCDALDDHPVSFELAKLSTFLLVNYKSFVSALRASNATVSALLAMRKQLNLGYDETFAEAESVLARALGNKGAFWRFTV